MKKTTPPSEKTQQEALGIALYKKQQKEKARQADKAKKKVQRSKQIANENSDENQQPKTLSPSPSAKSSILPWMLLVISWVGFFVYASQAM